MTAIPRRLLAAAFGVLLLIECAGCKKEQGEILPPEGEYTSGGGYQPKVPDVSAQLEAAIAKNSDVVGWLQLPNTAINEAVELTRKYESPEVVAFVNGILGSFVRAECGDESPRPEKPAADPADLPAEE